MIPCVQAEEFFRILFRRIKAENYLEMSLPFRMCVTSEVTPHFIWASHKTLFEHATEGCAVAFATD